MDFFNKPILSTKRLVTLAVVVAVVLLFHWGCGRDKSEESEQTYTPVSELFSPYTPQGVAHAWEQNLAVAQKLYRADLDKGEVEGEFSGLRVCKYRFKALNNDDLAGADIWAFMAPFVAAVMLLVAILGSLAYGLAYLTRLDSYHDATKF